MNTKTGPKKDLEVLRSIEGKARAVVFGRRCLMCYGPLIVPLRGRTPDTCSPRCRVALCRLRKKRDNTKKPALDPDRTPVDGIAVPGDARKPALDLDRTPVDGIAVPGDARKPALDHDRIPAGEVAR